MKQLNSIMMGFLLVEICVSLACGEPLRTRRAPCVRGAGVCTEGRGITEIRAMINGLDAIKKVLVRRILI